jgi:HlyD family secretion protein
MISAVTRSRLLPLWTALILWSAAGPSTAAETTVATPKPPTITVVKAETGTIAETILVTGTLVARDEVLVHPEIDGLAIVELLAEEGDKVARGQVLARLSRDTLDAELAQNTASIERAAAAIAQARSQIAEAEATRAQAEAAFNRARVLQDRGNASTETLEQREASARVAVARVAAAQQALHVAEADKGLAEAQRRELMVRLARTEIKAPAAGIVSRRTARLGALATMAGDPLFRIIGNGVVELAADVPETVLVRLRVGQTAKILPAGRLEAIPARLRLVSPEVSRTTRLGSVRLALDPVPGLAVGAFARGMVEIDRRDGTLVPLSAVLHASDGSFVQIVRDGIIDTRPVRIGLKADGRAEILDGVAPGEDVVAISGTFVRHGDRVNPVVAKSAAGANSAMTPNTTPKTTH